MSMPSLSRWAMTWSILAVTWLMWLCARRIAWFRPKFRQEPRQRSIAALEWEISKVEPPDLRELFLIMLQDRAELGPHHLPVRHPYGRPSNRRCDRTQS